MTFDLPTRLQTRVQRLAHDGDLFVGDLDGRLITCDNVVIATGTFGRTPHVPAFAGGLDSRMVQLHSSEYRRPAQLPEGPVLVVGASHSGLDIAYELGSSRTTTLVGPARGKVPLEWGTRSLQLAFPFIEFTFNHVLTRRTPMGRKVMAKIRYHGAPQLRVKRHHFGGTRCGVGRRPRRARLRRGERRRPRRAYVARRVAARTREATPAVA